MPEEKLAKVEQDRRAIREAKNKGILATVGTYTRLSGPGWLQSALTLGGGSLGSSLYLGVLVGFGILWLQPVAMILGIIMLSAIGYVAMSTDEPPFQGINRHINPVLGWGWALATLAANMVWCLPQYSLASGVLQQNLLPDVLGAHSPMGDFWGKVVISACILLLTLIVTWAYDAGGWGIKLYELILKLVVAMIVLCFIAVVVVISWRGSLDWGAIFAGFIPDVTTVFKPSDAFHWLLDATPDGCREFWSSYIVSQQRGVIISAAATAVGINMTFLLPYSMLRRGWDKEFRGLAIFDLSTGMFVPYLLATSCVVIAAANQFHPMNPTADEIALVRPGNTQELPKIKHPDRAVAPTTKWLERRLDAPVYEWLQAKAGVDAAKQLREQQAVKQLIGAWTKRELAKQKLSDQQQAALDRKVPWRAELLQHLGELTRAERLLMRYVQQRDAFDLSQSLTPLTGKEEGQQEPSARRLGFTDTVFGIGVVGMTLSSITLLMLISGFVICEMLGLPPKGWPNRLGALAATTGVLGPFLWSDYARFWLVVPTSIFCMSLLPIAYVTFLLMMNSKSLLKDQMPRGGRRFRWNLLMGVAVLAASTLSLWVVWIQGRYWGLAVVAAFILLVLFVHFAFPRNRAKKE